MQQFKKPVLILAVLATCLAMPLAAFAGESHRSIDPKADSIVKKMSNYMASLKQFSAETQNSYESILDSGQKLTFINNVKILIKRPGSLYAHRKGTIRNQEFFIHDKILTLYSHNLNMYATTTVPAIIPEALDYATEELGLNTPGSDIFLPDIYSALMEEVTSGTYLGKSVLNGITCHHVAFRSSEVDWQMWIEDGARPIPRRYIITSKWLTGAPEYTVDIIKFDTETGIPDSKFIFTPPKGASHIQFLNKNEVNSAAKKLKKEINP
jgi:hypothetical protein